jgi:D-beta-D-heptose 7-phosphate kinase / D-beta-D-heptose 1-phosphate adenosyltransferase
VVRFDREDTLVLQDEVTDELVARVERNLRDESTDVLVLSDYAKGTLGHEVCRRLISLAREHRVPVIVDPKGRDYARYHGATMITPNTAELRDAVGLPDARREELLERGQALRSRLALTRLVLTEGSGGMSLLDASGARRFPARRREVFDVSGAGDTVVAVLAAALASRVDIDIACQLANVAAGLVIGHVGTSPLNAEEFRATLEAGEGGIPTGVYSLGDLAQRVRNWRTRGEKVVFTNGCFDLLHAGHLSSLEAARREGERLVVAINSDRSVARLKGPGRPVNREQDRARVLAALGAVDAVCVFDDETPLEVIRALRPDVLAKGADYHIEDVVGAEDVQSWGGRVVLLDLVTGLSTTELVRRIESRTT